MPAPLSFKYQALHAKLAGCITENRMLEKEVLRLQASRIYTGSLCALNQLRINTLDEHTFGQLAPHSLSALACSLHPIQTLASPEIYICILQLYR